MAILVRATLSAINLPARARFKRYASRISCATVISRLSLASGSISSPVKTEVSIIFLFLTKIGLLFLSAFLFAVNEFIYTPSGVFFFFFLYSFVTVTGGKSAILTALCVAFGCRAKGTQRASTLKDFIKTGCSDALVHVQMNNQGDDAFKPRVYGDTLVIERRISHFASSTVLKDSQGLNHFSFFLKAR